MTNQEAIDNALRRVGREMKALEAQNARWVVRRGTPVASAARKYSTNGRGDLINQVRETKRGLRRQHGLKTGRALARWLRRNP